MWYNEGTKNVVSGGAVNTPDRIHLIGDVPMDTLPHSALSGNHYTIYALIDPRDDAIRYIGITHDVYQRMRQHSRCAGNNEAKNAWIRELQVVQQMFIMHAIEKVATFEQALERESYYIARALQEGEKLLNIAGVTDPASPIPQKRASKPPRLIRNIPIHVDSWVLMDYPIWKRNHRLVTVEEATTEEFQAWLDWNEIDTSVLDGVRVPEAALWGFDHRYLIINHALDQGMSLELADGNVVCLN